MDPYEDYQYTQADWEHWLYNAHAYPPQAYAFEQGFPRRDFLRDPNERPF
jgi:hypothetical protein